jgi:hypothetical protein
MMDIVKKKHNSFIWKDEAEKIFNILNEKIIERRIMVLLNFEKTFQVRCDASGVAIGAILSQDNKHVAYFSEKLNDTKRNYSTYDKEFDATIQDL